MKEEDTFFSLSEGIVSFGVLVHTYNYNHSQFYRNASCNDEMITDLLVVSTL